MSVSAVSMIKGDINQALIEISQEIMEIDSDILLSNKLEKIEKLAEMYLVVNQKDFSKEVISQLFEYAQKLYSAQSVWEKQTPPSNPAWTKIPFDLLCPSEIIQGTPWENRTEFVTIDQLYYFMCFQVIFFDFIS